MIKRDYYPIEDAASQIGCTVDDLIHLAAKERLKIYGRFDRGIEAHGIAMLDWYPDGMPPRPLDPTGWGSLSVGVTEFMTPPSHYFLQLEAGVKPDIMFFMLPEMTLRRSFHGRRLEAAADNEIFFLSPEDRQRGISIRLFLMAEEIERIKDSSGKVNAKPTLTDNSLLGTIAALLAAWPGGKSPSGKDLEKAAESVGVAITDCTIRKAMKAAREIAEGLPPA